MIYFAKFKTHFTLCLYTVNLGKKQEVVSDTNSNASAVVGDILQVQVDFEKLSTHLGKIKKELRK